MNLSKKIKALNGKDLNGKDTVTMADVIARILSEEKHADPMRAYLVALDVKKGEKLNQSDTAFIKEAVKKTQAYVPLIVGQILLELEKTVKKVEVPKV